MKRPTRSPGIPQVRSAEDVPGAWDNLRTLLEQWKGSLDPLDGVITKRDLREAGLDGITVNRQGQIVSQSDDDDPTAGRPGGERDTSVQFPPPPTGFVVTSGFNSIFLRWNDPRNVYRGHAHTEVWRADVDDLGQAVRIEPAIAGYLYQDEFDETYSVTRYYWIRWVNENGQVGPYQATSGQAGNTSNSPDLVRDLLTSQDWQATHDYGLFEVIRPNVDVVRNGLTLHFQVSVAGTSGASEPDWTVVTAIGDTLTDGSVTWTAIEASQAPFVTGTLNGEPVVYMPGAFIEDATITNAKILNVSADKLTAGTIDAQEIDVINIQAENIVGTEITGLTFQTAEPGGERAALDASVNALRFWDGGGTLRAQIGGSPTFFDGITSRTAYAVVGDDNVSISGLVGLSQSGYGLFGESLSNDGVRGISDSNDGVKGSSSSGATSAGVRGERESSGGMALAAEYIAGTNGIGFFQIGTPASSPGHTPDSGISGVLWAGHDDHSLWWWGDPWEALSVAGKAVGALGTIAYLRDTRGDGLGGANGASPGDEVSGSSLRYSNDSGYQGSTPSGTWMCLGEIEAGGTQAGTAWMRVA